MLDVSLPFALESYAYAPGSSRMPLGRSVDPSAALLTSLTSPDSPASSSTSLPPSASGPAYDPCGPYDSLDDQDGDSGSGPYRDPDSDQDDPPDLAGPADDLMGSLLRFPAPTSSADADTTAVGAVGTPRLDDTAANAGPRPGIPSSPRPHPLLPSYTQPIPPSLIIPSRSSYSIISELVRNRDLYQSTDDDPRITIKNYPSTLGTAIDCIAYQVPVSRPGRGTVLACALHHGLDTLELDSTIEDIEFLRSRLHGPDSLSYMTLNKRQQIKDWMSRCPLRPDAMTGAGDTVSDLQVRIPKKSHNRLCGISETLGVPTYAVLLWCVMAGLSDQDNLREYSEMFSRAAREFVEVVKTRREMYRTLLGPLGET